MSTPPQPHLMRGMQLLSRVTYTPPSWAAHLTQPPHGKLLLAHLPTPIMPWACPALKDLGVTWSIKRDDITGLELSGNKVRKLEFLMAEALEKGHDCVVTIGGLQSNHCRATAAAARLAGLEPHLVLLVRDKNFEQDPGLQGNLLIDRLLGATLHLCSAKDYLRYGGDLSAMNQLNELVAEELRRDGRRPYVVPVGGTTPVATWGYIDAVSELHEQLGVSDPASDEFPYDHVVATMGSGGTVSGLALGCHLSRTRAALHAVSIHHSPEYFFDIVQAEATALGHEEGCPPVNIHNGVGAGYGVSTPDLLAFIRQVARESGVLLDHVYSGKCLYYFCQHALANPERFRNAHILFWHTGGAYALHSQEEGLGAHIPESEVQRMQVP